MFTSGYVNEEIVIMSDNKEIFRKGDLVKVITYGVGVYGIYTGKIVGIANGFVFIDDTRSRTQRVELSNISVIERVEEVHNG